MYDQHARCLESLLNSSAAELCGHGWRGHSTALVGRVQRCEVHNLQAAHEEVHQLSGVGSAGLNSWQ